MVNIDTVYQTVLALANKEQRGYITPQEFNLFANQAQMSIFEQYFYDLNQFIRVPGNDTAYSDVVNILEEKIALFEKSGVTIGNGTTLPNDLYKLSLVKWLNPIENKNYTVEYVTRKEWFEMKDVELVKPTDNRLIYIRNRNGISVIGNTGKNTGVTCDYVAVPRTPKWTYIVVDEKALYNPDAADHQNFQLHVSEQTQLVEKILQLAGVTLKDPSLYQIGSAEENKSIQQQKA